jgi:hypothetical protein
MPHNDNSYSSISGREIKALFLSLARQTFSKYGAHYLWFLASALIHNPRHFPAAVALSVKGYHLFKMTDDILKADTISAYMKSSIEKLELQYETKFNTTAMIRPAAVERLARRAMGNVRRIYRALNPELKDHLKDAYYEFKLKCETIAYLWAEKAVIDEDAMFNRG